MPVIRKLYCGAERGQLPLVGGGPKVEFKNVPEDVKQNAITFDKLLEMVALVNPEMRIRFSTSHPKDISDEVLFTMAKYDNICNHIHLPAQSGSTGLLEAMNRTYSREWYLQKYNKIREILPDCSVSCDIIAGFCGETDEDHWQT